MDNQLKDMEKENKDNQRPAVLQLQAQKPRLAVKADVLRQEESSACGGRCTRREISVDTSSAWVDDNPMNRTSFGCSAKPVAPKKSIDGALVDEGAEVPKPRLSHVEMRMLTLAAGGLLHAGSASTKQGTISRPQPLHWSEKRSRREILYGIMPDILQVQLFLASKDDRNEIKPGLIFDPGGWPGHLVGGQRTLFRGGMIFVYQCSIWGGHHRF